MKKIISLLMVLVLGISLFGTLTIANAAEPKVFTDIADHWAKTDIDYLTAKGIVNGVSDTEFAPEKPVTRAEFLTLVLKALGEDEAKYTDADFDYAKLIEPVIPENSDFDFDANITRETC